MWAEESETLGRRASDQSVLVAQAIADIGLRRDARLDREVRDRICKFGDAEWERLGPLELRAVAPDRARYLLGAGYALTGFLIAPFSNSNDEEHGRLCSLGAIVNLMVVVCDRLLDGGAATGDVLPPADSSVTLLLQEYLRGVEEIGVDGGHRRTIEKLSERMFEAERRTVCGAGELPFRYWLRKCALPFVLMAAAALRQEQVEQVRWLYKVGRFFGAVDDAVDFIEDRVTGHPNCWLRWQEDRSVAAADRVAGWGRQILDEWGSLVPRTAESAVLRETFLYNIWEWLEAAISAPCQLVASSGNRSSGLRS